MAIPILLVLLLPLACATSEFNLTGNLALEAPSVLSSTFGGYAHYAVDGGKDTSFDRGSCTHTDPQTDPWWRVDLSRPYNITRVTITNRGDCCVTRINGAQIRIGNSLENDGNDNTLASLVESIGRGQSRSFEFAPLEGQYVNIFLPGEENTLSLCEVNVFAGDEGDLALRRQATQSSTYAPQGLSKFAVDGDRNPNYLSKGCATSASEDNPWWRVDLLKSYKIARVTITNRGDCCSHHVTGAEIHIGDSLDNHGNSNTLAAVVQSIPAGETLSFDFKPTRGRYVNVVSPRKDTYLMLCEVEVYAILGNNVAPRGRATQSSLILGEMSSFGHALNAIDGNPNPDQLKGSCSMTDRETDPWWRVDLHERYSVSSVALTIPMTGSPEGLNGVHIRIGDSTNAKENPLCAELTSVPLGETVHFGCTEAKEGQFVTVVLLGEKESLSLCEVEVFGTPVTT